MLTSLSLLAVTTARLSNTINLSYSLLDLDYIMPFNGIPENGHEIDGLDERSELALCRMLVNLLRVRVREQ